MTSISVNDLSLSFGIKPVLEKVSFSLEEGDKLGIIGVNGCGKSTLFKLILGELEPDEGNIFFSKNKTVGVLTQDGAFTVSDLCGHSVLEQMYTAYPQHLRAEARLAELETILHDESKPAEETLRASTEYAELYRRYSEGGGLEFRGRAAAILTKMGFDAAAQAQDVETLSGGQRTRLALAKQLCAEPNILLLDEPTNHLDIETMGWLENFLCDYAGNVLIISHDRFFLDRVTNKTLRIEHCRAKLYNGGYTASVAQYEEDRAIQEKHYQIQQKEIARQEAYIAQQRAWNRERNIIAAESREKALERMVKIERPKAAPKSIRMHFTASGESGNEVLRARGLGMGFGTNQLFRDLDFLIKKRERVFIVGPNGCGKSTLIKLMLDQLSPTAGLIEFGYNVEIGYYDQENQNLDPTNTVLEELWSAYPTLPELEIRNALALFLFRGDDIEKTVSVLSGGERARLTLAKLILSKMNLLILDEPTNHLDINSREALEAALDGFDGTLITVSHDRYLIDKLATRILALSPGEAMGGGDLFDYRVTHEGQGYSELRALMAEREAAYTAALADAPAAEASTGREQYLQQKKSRNDARNEKKRREALAREQAKLEKELEALEEELWGEAATNYVRAAEIETRKNEVEERLMEIYEEIGI